MGIDFISCSITLMASIITTYTTLSFQFVELPNHLPWPRAEFGNGDDRPAKTFSAHD
jgi:hypothetical protein